MLSNIVIIVVILVIISLSIKGTISHFKGEGSCCGGGGSDFRTKPRKLNNVVSTRIVYIDGMHCEHCYTRVHNLLNSIDGVSARVDGRKGRAVLKLDRDIRNTLIEKAISDLGYKVVSISEK